jgi:hypothetical protein
MVGALIYLFIGEIFIALSATALKNTKWRLSSQNHKLFEFPGQVLKSPTSTHIGLICVENPRAENIS